VNRTDAVDHLPKSDLARGDKTVSVLLSDTVGVARQDDQVTLGFAEKERVFVDTGDSRAPDCLKVAADLLQFILDPVLTRDVSHDANTLHEISNHDHVVDNGDIDRRSRCPISGEFLELERSRVVINCLVDDDLGGKVSK